MKVRELIQALLDSDIDMDAEVMISAPLECDRSNPRKGLLDLPTHGISAGRFVAPDIVKGRPWVRIQGTDAWGMYFPRAKPETT
jgi:hypothetical protein